MKTAVLIGFILACLAIGLIGAIPNVRAIPTWYQSLRKPAWTPPNRVFAPVWTLLYLLMAVAAWRCWLLRGFDGWPAPFMIQLALNVAWSWIFFGSKKIGLALVEMVGLLVSIESCLFIMSEIDPISSFLLVPYLLWVGFALSLNFGFWVLNR